MNSIRNKVKLSFFQGSDGEVFNRVRVQPTSSLFSYQTTTNSPISPMRKASIHRLKDKYKSQLTRESQPTLPALKARDSLKIKAGDDDDDDNDDIVSKAPTKFITGKPLTATRCTISLTFLAGKSTLKLEFFTKHFHCQNGLAFLFNCRLKIWCFEVVPDRTRQELMSIRAEEPRTTTQSSRIETEPNPRPPKRPRKLARQWQQSSTKK